MLQKLLQKAERSLSVGLESNFVTPIRVLLAFHVCVSILALRLACDPGEMVLRYLAQH